MLTISDSSLRAADPDAPVYGPVRFIGRAGLVKQLAARVSAWQSVRLNGGPKAGVKAVLPVTGEKLRPFFEACAQAVGPDERRLLRWLIKKGKPVNPKEAARALKVPSIKTPANTLCSLGLDSRWNLEDGAKLHASCRLFNDWLLAQRG